MHPGVRWKRFLGLAAISAMALAIHGYHYGIEDEAVYLPAVKKHLDAGLYPFDSAFFEFQLRLAFFDEFMASLSSITHLPLDWTFFSVYCLSTFLLVLVLRQLAERFFQDERARWAAVLLPCALLTLPVAGTALFIMDQHMHPRNLATIAMLFALVAAIDRRRVLACALMAPVALLHPMMALYGASLVSLFVWRTLLLHYLGFALFLPFAWFLLPPVSAAWQQASEAYLYVTKWAWYEWVGVFGPLAGLLACRFWAKLRELPLMVSSAWRLVQFSVFYTLVALTVACVPRFEQLVRLQPMRNLQPLYLLLFFFVGGIIGQTFRRQWALAASALFLVLCGGMFYAQRQEFPASPHIELPGRVPDNAWLRAFDWVRRNTPQRAHFVMDPRYLERPGEDFHGFRALAERSVLADQIKDRSVSTTIPSLAEEWLRQSEAQRNWKSFSRADLLGLKQRFGVDWVLFERATPPNSGDLPCPYQNNQIRICRIE